MIKVNGPKIRELRGQHGFTLEALAKKAGIGARTLGRMETESCDSQDQTVKALAKALDTTPASITDAAPDPVSKTDVERAGRLEVGRGVARVEERSGARVVNAAVLHGLNSAHLGYEGDEYKLRGRVETHREITDLESVVLGGDPGACARFLVATPIVDGRSLRVTVHTQGVKMTTRLINAYEDGASVELRVRVVVARRSVLSVNATGCGPGAERPADVSAWRGFEKLVNKDVQQWTFIVQSVRTT